MRKLGLMVAVIGMWVVLPIGAASAAECGTNLPMSGHWEVTFSFSGRAGTGSIIASHVGRGAFTLRYAGSGVDGVVTAANGDELFIHANQLYAGPYTVTGGTGRFTGATGGGHTSVLQTGTGDPDVVLDTGDVDGVLNLALPCSG